VADMIHICNVLQIFCRILENIRSFRTFCESIKFGIQTHERMNGN
jgi:hypothetical protein